MRRLALGLLALWPAAAGAQDTVVLVHGILNKPFFMARLESALEKDGYAVVNWGYASTERSIEEYAQALHARVEALNSTGTVHFVGFSLGSIILRECLANHPPARAGRFVQIAPPNHGSRVINELYDFRAFRWVYGEKAIAQLKADGDFLKNLGAPKIPFGIIAGGLGNGKGFSPALEGDDDGSVAVASARLDGAADFVLIPREHTLLLIDNETLRQVRAFLKDGKFSPEAHP